MQVTSQAFQTVQSFVKSLVRGWAFGLGRKHATRRRCREGFAHVENLEPRQVMSATPMQVGINLDNVVDYLPNWMFTDAFQSSRPWISHSINTVTGQRDFNGGSAIPVQVDANGWPTQLATWTNASGQLMRQELGTLMFRSVNAEYPAGTYRAEWDGSGDVVFGFDALEVSRGMTADGHHFALLNVAPGNQGIYLGIRSLDSADPIRDIHVWMPDYNGQSFAGQRWQPGADFSPFHPLYKERLDDFGILRFMQTQETNSSDIRTWADRRDANDARQNSGLRGPMANGISVEHMVQLANELDADPWFNMPHMADDDFVRNFATYVRDNLEPGLTAHVEWSNEIWNTAPGFDAAPWITEQLQQPENAGLTQFQLAGREAARDMNLWSEVFAGQTDRIVRTAGGQAANAWVTERIVENMGGSFDAIAIAPYFGPTQAQRATYSATTTVDQVLNDLRNNLAGSTQFTLNHQRLADEFSLRLGRDIQLLAYEGGPHLNANNAPYQNVWFQVTKDPRMADLMRDYLRQQNAAGLDSYVHYKLTDRDAATPYGLFGVLLAQDQPTSEAHVYRTLLEADAGTLFTAAPTLVTASVGDATGREAGRESAGVRVTRGGDLSQPLTVNYSVNGTAAAGVDYTALSGRVTFPANENTTYIIVNPINDTLLEGNETVTVRLAAGAGYSLIGGTTATATVTIISDDRVANAPTLSLTATDAIASEQGNDPAVFTITRSNGDLNRALTVYYQFGFQTAQAGDFDARAYRPSHALGNYAIELAAGQTSATITIRPVDDSVRENRETVVLLLDDNSLNYFVGNRTATVSILDNDAPLPTVTIAATDANAAEANRDPGTFVVTRNGSSLAAPLTVNYSLSGSATNGTDYDNLTGSVTIAAGQASATITLRPVDDASIETTESATVTLAASPGYLLGATTAATVSIIDNDVPTQAPLPVLIVISNGDFYYREYADPRAALLEAGIPVVVAAGRRQFSIPHANSGQAAGTNGGVMPDIALADANASNYSAILFVGGWGASQYQYAFTGTYTNPNYNGTVAIRERVNQLINDFVAQDKYVTAVCHGVSILAWARVNGQSLLQGRTVTTAHFNSPTNNIPAANLYRWHSEVNGATVYTGGVLGDPTTRNDDIWVDGRIITGENFDSARLFGQTLAQQLRP